MIKEGHVCQLRNVGKPESWLFIENLEIHLGLDSRKKRDTLFLD